ncbi:temptin-like [Saccostrea cucullata]|uniref:temptin-like n=1 Tax=Saccostrea cuccullata TaxID=36930 RepID=UPI002ECFE514
MMKHVFIFVVNAVSILCVFSYPGYLANLPVNEVPFLCRNGSNEEHTYSIKYIGHEVCVDKKVITGIFHERNIFGSHFSWNDQDWTKLCQMDSDDDGRSNGVEMGDPNCEWTPNSNVTLTAVSHPGYSEIAETSNNGTKYVGECSRVNINC